MEQIQRDPAEIFNQSTPLEDYNLFDQDTALSEALKREGASWFEEGARKYGALLGQAHSLKLGDLANKHTPVLKTHNRFGYRVDEVEYHPAWHDLMRLGIEHEIHSLPWTEKRKGSHVARSAMVMMKNQIDEGSCCPLTMCFAVIPTLRLQPDIGKEWERGVLSRQYDFRFIPANKKSGLIFGMGMTERQGGSDVRANTTIAKPLSQSGPGKIYELTGHKWFCSAPMSDGFLVLAQAPKGLSCFLLPRWRTDGSLNGIRINRLKDKVGNRSNASSEVEFHKSQASLIGEEGRGVSMIIEMVRHTRLDCSTGSAGTLRRAVAEATHHASFRSAFGKKLNSHPLMQNVLADLCLESEAATAFAFRIARSFDEGIEDKAQHGFSRLATAIGKYWITKRAISVVAEAVECIGGNGFIEESPLARLYRDVPTNSIWEGPGNIQCLDVLRTLQKEPESLNVYLKEVQSAKGGTRYFDEFLAGLNKDLADLNNLETRARTLVEKLALAMQAALLIKNAPTQVAEAFCSSRLNFGKGGGGLSYGTLTPDTDFNFIIERSRPKI